MTVSAGSNAPNGTQKLNVLQVAQASSMTGGELKRSDGKSVTGSTKLSELGYTNGEAEIKVTVGGKAQEIKVTGETTVDQFVGQLKDKGLNVNFDEKNQRIFVNAKETGSAGDFKIEDVSAGNRSAGTGGSRSAKAGCRCRNRGCGKTCRGIDES